MPNMICNYLADNREIIVKYHRANQSHIDLGSRKSMLWQILNGIHYLHSNYVIHRGT